MEERPVTERAKTPLVFQGCHVLIEITGSRARHDGELHEGNVEAPPESIFYHTNGFLLEHRFIVPKFINQFSKWAYRELHCHALADSLSSVDPQDFTDLEDLRWEFVRVLDNYVREAHIVPRIVHGQPFHFLRSRLQTVPTGVEAWTLRDLREGLAEIDVSAIYYHLIESRRSLGRAGGGLAGWIRDELGGPRLAERVAAIDTFMYSLEDLRMKLLDVLNNGETVE